MLGISEYAARFPNALLAIIQLPALYLMGRQLSGPRLGMWWALVWMGSTLPQFYFRTGIIDPWFNFFMMLSLYGLIVYHFRRNGFRSLAVSHGGLLYLTLSGISLGLAVLTKGPVAILLVGGTAFLYWVVKARFTWYIHPLHGLWWLLVALLTAGCWYGYITWLEGTDFVVAFTERQIALFSTPDAGHGGFPGYHIVVLLVGCFPASLLVLALLSPRTLEAPHIRDMKVWMTLLALLVLVLFSVVESKIVHYSSMAYFPLTFLAATFLHDVDLGKRTWPRWLSVAIVLVLAMYLVVSWLGPWLGNHPELLIGIIDDAFVEATLSEGPDWPWYTYLPGVMLLFPLVLFLAPWRFRHARIRPILLLGATTLYTTAATAWFMPRVGAYSQDGAVALLQDLSDEDVYAITAFRSYLPAWYLYPQPDDSAFRLPADWVAPTPPSGMNTLPYLAFEWNLKQWILYGPIDRPAYIIARIQQTDRLLQDQPALQATDTVQGFVRLVRMP